MYPHTRIRRHEKICTLECKYLYRQPAQRFSCSKQLRRIFATEFFFSFFFFGYNAMRSLPQQIFCFFKVDIWQTREVVHLAFCSPFIWRVLSHTTNFHFKKPVLPFNFSTLAQALWNTYKGEVETQVYWKFRQQGITSGLV